jgi:hypothetical protein
MYASEDGSEHDWFEIYNNGDSDVNLENFKFNDGNEGGHVFEKPPKNDGQGSLIISSGEYVIVAKEADTFLNAHLGFSNTVIDASFSLLNKLADSLFIFRIDDGEVIDTASYEEDAGAEKNGLSLHFIDGIGTPSTPTPGTGELSTSQTTQAQSQEVQEENNITTKTITNFPVEPQIFAFAGENKTVTVGASSLFKGVAMGLIGDPLNGGRFIWSFGDGGRAEGASVLHNYKYPGKYVVILDVSSGEYSATDRIQVTAIPANITVSIATVDFIELKNNSDRELNLSWWMFNVKGVRFTIPEHTIILPESSIMFSNEVTRLSPNRIGDVQFLYPNGAVVVQEGETVMTAAFSSKFTSEISISPNTSIVGKAIAISMPNTEPKEEPKEKAEENLQLSASVASVIQKGEKEEDGLYKWLFTLIVIIIGAIISVIFLRRMQREEITIID